MFFICFATYLLSVSRLQNCGVNQFINNRQFGRSDWLSDPNPHFTGLNHFVSFISRISFDVNARDLHIEGEKTPP
jgi:hypothetical protein